MASRLMHFEPHTTMSVRTRMAGKANHVRLALALLAIHLSAIQPAIAASPPKPPKDFDRTLTISPESGSSFLACQEIELLIESAEMSGVTNISLFRDNVKVAQSETS